MILGMILGALLMLAGITVGLLVGLTLKRKTALPPAPKPECSCGHPRGYHLEQGTGKCNFSTYHPTYKVRTECACRMYDGPVPMPEYYSPEITG